MEEEKHIDLAPLPQRKYRFFFSKNFMMIALFGVLGLGSILAVVLSQQRTEFISKANTSTITVGVVEDTWVNQSNPTKTNGSDKELKVDNDKVAYLKFNLEHLTGQPISRATLRLFIVNDSKSTQQVIEATTNDWNEKTLTYSTKPESGESFSQITNTTKNTVKEIDLTAFVTSNAGKTVTLVINASPENKNNLYFAAKESANPPVIVIETTSEGTGATATTTPTITSVSVQPSVAITIPPIVVPTYSGGSRMIQVATAAQLTAALANAQPGDAITMADGTYSMKSTSVMIGKQNASAAFRLTRSGTASSPIVLQGSRKAIIDGNDDYGLHLFHANYVHIKGITVAYGKKGIMLDNANHTIIDGVEVRDIGMEGVHFRSFSSDNIIKNSYVHHTGKDKKTGALDQQYGEGIYVGSANSNWGTYTNGQMDKSDRNQIISNVISYTGGEGIDIKEGTVDGVIRNNSFDNAGIAGGFADSWVDIKGNNWLITGNKGVNALEDGYQVHGVYAGWGNNNTFINNSASGVPNYGFWVQNNVTGNIIACNNTVANAGKGLANVSCVTQ